MAESAPLADNQVQVAYKRGIVDNENDSIVDLCNVLGVHVVAARVATTYQSNDAELAAVIKADACNPNIEELHDTEPDLRLAPTNWFLRTNGNVRPSQS